MPYQSINGHSPFQKTMSTKFLVRGFASLVLVTICLFFLLPNSTKTPNNLLPISHEATTKQELKSDCKIPFVPLRSPAYIAASKYTKKISQCGDGSKFTEFINETTLKLSRTDAYQPKNCQVFEITRPYNHSTDGFVKKFAGTIDDKNEIHSLKSEFAIVKCDTTEIGTSTLEYQSRIQVEQEPLKSLIERWESVDDDMPINVMMLVLDSTSTTDAFRNLPNLMKYLLEDLKFSQFNRFHALGEPTFLNALPLLTGIETRAFFKKKTWDEKWDKTDFIWKNFNRSGYATAYLEDIPAVGTFNYGGQTGFVNKPTTFYLRPLFLAFEKFYRDRDHCVGTFSMWRVLLDYPFQILKSLNGKCPTFTITWPCWPFHDFFNTLDAIEPVTMNFFQKISQDKEILENTLLIVMADHGFYQGEYAKTHEGYLERRLPLFLLRLPERLKKFIPNVEEIINHNSKEIVSHYDIYKTLIHLSQLSSFGKSTNLNNNVEDNSFGRSILKWIPKGRLCKDAGIPHQWCACNLPEVNFTKYSVVPEVVQIHPVEKFVDRNRQKKLNTKSRKK